MHAAKIADAAKIVARQVHEHNVLGTLFRVGQEFFLESFVFGDTLATGAGAGDGADLHAPVFGADVDFRRGAHE